MMLFLRPFLGHISLGLAALCLILAGLWQMDKQGAKKWKARAQYYQGELNRISTARDEQRKKSQRNVDSVVNGNPETKVIVRTIREAPIPEDCKTPGLETLRDAV